MPSSAAWRVRVASLTFSSSCLRSWLSRRYPLTSRRLRRVGGTASALPKEWRTYDELELINGVARDYHPRLTPGGVRPLDAAGGEAIPRGASRVGSDGGG